MLPRPPSSTLFPYTTLFRSVHDNTRGYGVEATFTGGAFYVRPRYARFSKRRPEPDEIDRLRASVEGRSEEHTSELQSHSDLVCRLLLEKKKNAGKVDNAPRL